jgi:UDPglucose--hexose-1-phosphate uridylyltransferase
VTRTAAKLADGRDLYYFDDAPGADRSAVDRRELDATSTASEIRYDVLSGEWVVIASHRQGRTHLPPTTECPLCPSNATRSTEVPSPSYDVVVFENRFPSLSYGLEGEFPEGADSTGFLQRPGIGRCEVVCFTDDHSTSFAHLSPRRVATVLAAWTDRTAELSALPGVEQVFPFENRGEEIGVTLAHPHGQIYAYPFLPPRVRRMVETAARHRQDRGGCLYCAVVEREEADGARIVARGEHWTAFVPRAARWPFEVHLAPRRHLPDLTALDDAERAEFPTMYLDVLHRFDGIFGQAMPYIAGWQQAPVGEGHDLLHLFLQVFSIRRAPGKLKYLAGSESAMGTFINDIAPEQAAGMLRDVR